MDLTELMENYIPYEIRTQVSSIDPRLDVFWQDYLFDIFKELSTKDRQNVAQQILAPKHIHWNKDSKKFEYTPPRKILILMELLKKFLLNTRQLSI